MAFIRKNFAKGILASNLVAGGSQLTVQVGHTLPIVAGNFRLVIWDNTNFPDPADDPKLEIVTASFSGTPNVYDITRAQEDTLDVAHSLGNRVGLHYTAGMSEADVNHNNLTSLQGGTTNEYYHLTSDQHTNVLVGEYVPEYKALEITR